MVTFEKKPTPRDEAINRMAEKLADQHNELMIYQVTLALIALAAFTQVMGWA